jgi:outer membrane protein TolC
VPEFPEALAEKQMAIYEQRYRANVSAAAALKKAEADGASEDQLIHLREQAKLAKSDYMALFGSKDITVDEVEPTIKTQGRSDPEPIIDDDMPDKEAEEKSAEKDELVDAETERKKDVYEYGNVTDDPYREIGTN